MRPGMRKVLGPTRFTGGIGSSSSVEYLLDPTPGGARCKNVLYSFRVLQASSKVGIGCTLYHGPDGTASVQHSVILASSKVGSSYPTLLSGSTNADNDGQLGEWFHPRLTVSGGSSQWVSLEIYELRKPC